MLSQKKHLKEFLWRKTIISNKTCKVNAPNKKGYFKAVLLKIWELMF